MRRYCIYCNNADNHNQYSCLILIMVIVILNTIVFAIMTFNINDINKGSYVFVLLNVTSSMFTCVLMEGMMDGKMDG